MKLRQFKSSDQAQAEALILAGLADYFPNLKPEFNPDVLDITSFYVAKGHSVWVLEQDNRLIGVGILKVYENNSGEIVRVSVDGEFRRRGIGRYLTNHLINQARALSLSTLTVETNANWTAPNALYQQLGFTKYKRLTATYDPQLTEIYYKLALKDK